MVAGLAGGRRGGRDREITLQTLEQFGPENEMKVRCSVKHIPNCNW